VDILFIKIKRIGGLVMATPDILNSKIKKIRIELPNYCFNHTSSGDSSQPFIGRERIREKLKRIIEDSPDEPGVYLVAGNRGVGKTSLVNKIINETSLRPDSPFFNKLKDWFNVKCYKEKYNRLYLRINFGHKLKDEKDILRLLASTLNTEYNRYRRSLWRMLPWRAMALCFLSVFLICVTVSDVKSTNSLNSAFSRVGTKVETAIETKTDTNVVMKVKTKIAMRDGNILFTLDQIIQRYIFSGKYLLWSLLFLIYLFCELLLRSDWLTRFLVTHQIIKRRIKKLNEDIIHSTERENTINISNGNAGSGIGTKMKKSRNVADVREIEKELQDILYDMQRIPQFMCRPKIVIVFDELDKVEPGDASLEKETPQTKASMFSINATRERQTEILRILSNMKYFLSTARAKFIFIAGREMFDIHLADVSERNNYIGSIFNAVIYVPSFLTDHPTSKRSTREESSIASLPEEFVCRKLFPPKYKVKTYNLKTYREYLEEKIFCEESKQEKIEKVEKIIAVLQQFIIYLAHVSKGAPKKMIQLIESFIEIRTEKDKYKRENTLLIRNNRKSEYFLTFGEQKQYTLGIIAYLVTPIFNLLSESKVKEHSDKLLVSSLRFVDFLFKFHKHPFSWWHLDISPELLEVNRAPELKSVTENLLRYLSQVYIDNLTFSYSIYKFNSIIANEIFAMTKTDEVFSALFSFSLDEMLPLKEYFQALLEKTENEYQNKKESSMFIDVVSSLQVVLGDLYYYEDELDQAQVYYNNAVQMFRGLEQNADGEIGQERFYLYIRNMFRLGMIYEKRKHYESAYITYGELCRRIIRERYIAFQELGVEIVSDKDKKGKYTLVKTSEMWWMSDKEKKYYNNLDVRPLPNGKEIKASIASLLPLRFKHILPQTYDLMFKRMTYEGLRTLYLPFLAKLQILEKSHMGGITCGHLELLDKEIRYLTFIIDNKESKILKAEFYTRVADILYYKNSDLKELSCKTNKKEYPQNSSCTACNYYHNALSALLNLNIPKRKNTVTELLHKSIVQIRESYDINMKYCTTLARIVSNWANVFFSCDNKIDFCDNSCHYICEINYHINQPNAPENIWEKYINYVESEEKNIMACLNRLNPKYDFTKMEIALAMYSISTIAYSKANQYKRSSYQLYKILCLFKYYECCDGKKREDYIKRLSERAINYLWCANDDLNMPELNKRKKDFGRVRIDEKITLQDLLVDTEITRIRVLVKDLELKQITYPKELKHFYEIRITSPYKINNSIVGRIYLLRLKSKVNYKAYQQLLEKAEIWEDTPEDTQENMSKRKKFVLEHQYYDVLVDNIDKETIKEIFGEELSVIEALENLIAESIYCLVDILQLSETMGETYLFSHSFVGSVHERLSFWIRQYEEYEKYKGDDSMIDEYLKKYLDEDWRELLSGYRENRQALACYCRCLEMHNEGRAYHERVDAMCYVRDDYNDRSDHFNIAEERHLIVNEVIGGRIAVLKDIYKDSELYKVENYFYKDYIDPQT
jgi:hypothetical protein